MRVGSVLGVLLVPLAVAIVPLAACSPNNRGTDAGTSHDAADAPAIPADACVGLECQISPCEQMGKPATTITGTVNAPNGQLPLYGVTVYVPREDPGEIAEGVQCTQCSDDLPGHSVARAQTDELGRFVIQNAPTGTDIPLVVTVGKWRRRFTIPSVEACAVTEVPAEATRLPRNKSEGDLPKIAVVTGSCDALECLIRKLGVDDAEFTGNAGDGRIHLYPANGVNKLASDPTVTLPAATTLWNDLDLLKQYDIGLFSCECSENSSSKPQAAMNNIKAYADAGGRLFLSHYHNVWIVGAGAGHQPQVWPGIATCNAGGFESGDDIIDQVANPKGPSFALWMQYATGTAFPGRIPIQEGRQTCSAIDPTKAERWVYFPSGGTEYPQNFQFTTPNEAADSGRCGKVVFSDMHVASGSSSSAGTPFPGGCSTAPMTPQELALAFMFFDIASCVGVIQ